MALFSNLSYTAAKHPAISKKLNVTRSDFIPCSYRERHMAFSIDIWIPPIAPATNDTIIIGRRMFDLRNLNLPLSIYLNIWISIVSIALLIFFNNGFFNTTVSPVPFLLETETYDLSDL